MESPNFPHLIPIYRRTPDEYDLGGVRIGWDDGFGSPSLQDDDLGKNNTWELSNLKLPGSISSFIVYIRILFETLITFNDRI